MGKTYKLNLKWQLFLFGFSLILAVFISILIPVYFSGKNLLFLVLILSMIALAGFLVFGALSTKIVLSPDGLISFAFGRSKTISWENFENIEINPVNLLVFAKLRHPPNDIFAISPFFSNNPLSNLLVDLAKHVPKEKFQKEIYEFICETENNN